MTRDGPVDVLLVDDEEPVLTLTSEWLESVGGIRVTRAASADESLGLLSSHDFDVIVSDYQMPKMDGIEFLKLLRGRGCTLPFILFTGRGREDVAIEAINNGADFYVQKGGDPSVQFAELLNMIRKSVERRKIERDLEESKELFDEIATNVHEAIVIASPDLRQMFYVSKGFEAIMGIPNEAALADPFRMFNSVHPGDLQRLRAAMTEIAARGFASGGRLDFRIVRPDKEVRWVSMRFYPVEDKKGETIRVTAFVEDDTERVGAALELKRTASDLTKVLESVSDGVLFADREGRVTYINGAAEKALGMRRGEVLGKTLTEVFAEFKDGGLRGVYRLSVESGSPMRAELCAERRGVEDWYDVRFFPSDAGMSMFFRVTTGERRAEEERRRTQERYRTIVELSNEGIISLDAEGRVVFVNQRMMQLTGRSAEECMMRPAVEFIHPDDRPAYAREMERRRAGSPGIYPLRLLGKEGGAVPVLVTATAMKNRDGKMTGSFAVCTDISGITAAQKQLSEEKEYSERLLNEMDVFFVATDRDGIVREYNKAAERISGFAREEVIGRSAFETVLRDGKYPDVERYPRSLWESGPERMSEKDLTHENPILTKSGEERLLLWRNSAFDHPQKGRMILSFGLDVTETRELERERSRLEGMYRSVVEYAPWGIHFYEMREDGKLVFVRANRAADRILGFETESRCGMTIEEAFPQLMSTVLPERYSEVARTGKMWWAEHARKLGGTASAVFSVHVFRMRPGRIAVFFQDVTARRRADEAARETEERIGLALALGYHDLSNELMVIEGQLALVAKERTAEGARMRAAKGLESAARLREQIRSYRQELSVVNKQAWLPMSSLLESARSSLDLGSVILRSDLDGVEVYADPLLEKVVTNLLANSLVHGGSVTRISVGAETSFDPVVLFFEDDGRGLSGEERERIYSPSNDGHALKVSRDVLRLSGIDLRVSDRDGPGARFELVVPRDRCRLSGSQDQAK